jgi:predicted metal-dependent phosphoesterase TrpH
MNRSLKKVFQLLVVSLIVSGSINAQEVIDRTSAESWNPNKVNFPAYMTTYRENLTLPKIKDFEVISCDFHVHTVFSDGNVWPSFRVLEAWKQGLDCFAMTDHVEYRPHKDNLNADLNTSYNIAKPDADKVGFMLIKGTEITRKPKTWGHFNALFINDANPIAVDDPKESLLAAKKQNAFIIWNHPGWSVDTTLINPFVEDIFNEGLIKGIEVYNCNEFYPRAMAWAIDKKLAIVAATDVHGIIEQDNLEKIGTLRPMTLVLAKERSIDGIREALEAGRTVAFFQGYIAAREEIATWLIEEYLSVKKVFSDEKSDFYTMVNSSSVPFKMVFNKKRYVLPALSTITFNVPNGTSKISVKFENIIIYENKVLAHDLQLF